MHFGNKIFEGVGGGFQQYIITAYKLFGLFSVQPLAGIGYTFIQNRFLKC